MKDQSARDIHALRDLRGLTIYPSSIIESGVITFFLAKEPAKSEKYLGIIGQPTGFEGSIPIKADTWLCPLTPNNASALRGRLRWLCPAPLGLGTSFGFGDRLGLATPGHVWALHRPGVGGIFAQQSVRENARTLRTPQIVLDDAMWGIFQEGWCQIWGADADHIKERADIGKFIDAGYTLFTFDPGENVDGAADTYSLQMLHSKVRDLPWQLLRGSPEMLYRKYLNRSFDLEDRRLTFDETKLLRAAVKYGGSIARTVSLYSYLEENIESRLFEVEIAVDETGTPTTIHEHFYLASELKRLGVRWVSFAPRFPGLLAKGVDYIGDLEAFAANVRGHAVVARALGPYKVSLHSGSDKFSIYPLISQATNGLLHVKTAGTSYLEALRVLASEDPDFFRQILELSRQRFESDKATYILSVQPEKMPSTSSLTNDEMLNLLDDFDVRQVLHVTYGSVLDRFGAELKSLLSADEPAYFAVLKKHFERHLEALG